MSAPSPSLGQLELLELWTSSGAMALTGRAERPLGPPERLVPGLLALEAELSALMKTRSAALPFRPLQAVVDRAAIAGLARGGEISCGGRAGLVRCRDGWLGVSLAREDDVGAVPAWLGVDIASLDSEEVFGRVAGEVATRRRDELVTRARLLGLPVAALGEVSGSSGGAVQAKLTGPSDGRPVEDFLVVDLSALWAGPLCAAVLQAAGGRVVKVESRSRPDATRGGPSRFFDLLNGGKESLSLDLGRPADLDLLRRLLRAADVVIEASRPRALRQLGIGAADLVAASPTVWVSITGYGRDEAQEDRVALGDDAAVAGGLVAWDAAGPCFCADAVADPLTGLVAAAAALRSLERGESVIIDVAMARVAAAFSGPTLPVPAGVEPCAPLASRPTARGPGLGAHDVSLRREFGP